MDFDALHNRAKGVDQGVYYVIVGAVGKLQEFIEQHRKPRCISREEHAARLKQRQNAV